MRREGRVSGKPTNRTRAPGKCRTVGCLGCDRHSHPLNKPVVKAKGHLKRIAGDITMNHRLNDWRVCNKITYDSEADLNANSGIWGFESSVEEKVLDHRMVDYGEEVYEYQSAQSVLEDPDVDDDGAENSDGTEKIVVEFPDLEASKHEFESFKSAIEAGCNQKSLPASENSWSGIEISEDDRSQTSWDEWSIVEGVV